MYIYCSPIVDLVKNVLHEPKLRLIPPIFVLFIFTLYRVFVPTTSDVLEFIIQILVGTFVIVLPSFLYYVFSPLPEKGLGWVDIISGLWVWFPVEFGLLEIWLGKIELGQIPSETLLSLFAFMYALIFIRNHDMGLTFTLNKEDFVYLSKINGLLVLFILPLGMIVYFLAPPKIILENFMILVNDLPGSLITVITTFLLIFLGIALIEEMFFRGFIYKLLEKKLSEGVFSPVWAYYGLVGLVLLIITTPWIDNILLILAEWIPFFRPVYAIVGPLARPLGDYEGQAWPLVEPVPLEFLYFLVAIILGTFAFIIVYKTQNPTIAALVLSSILFGWAHFEDVRYIFFASVAGLGYGLVYEKTQKIVPAAIVHMVVDAVWSLLLGF